MFCPSCGSENLPEAKYCGNCGEDLSVVIEQPEKKITKENHTKEEKTPFFKLLLSIGRKRKLIVMFGIILIIMIPVVYFVSQEGQTAYENPDVTTTDPATTEYGTRLEFNNSELFYTTNVNKNEAEKLGEYLVASGFFADRTISAQIDKKGGTFILRYVIQTGFENNNEYLEIVKQMVNEVSNLVFNNAPVEINLTDSRFNTLRVVNKYSVFNLNNGTVATSENNIPNKTNSDNNNSKSGNTDVKKPGNENSNYTRTNSIDYGELVMNVKGAKLYSANSMKAEEARRIGAALDKIGFFDNTKKTIQLSRDQSIYVFKQIIPEELEKDRAVLSSAKSTAALLKKNVFGSRPFEVQFTDTHLKALTTIKSGIE